jgi:acyl carrier protein
MDYSQVLSITLDILNSKFEQKELKITEQSQLITDGILTSLQQVIFVEELESRFKIEFNIGEINDRLFHSVAHVVGVIVGKMQKQASQN